MKPIVKISLLVAIVMTLGSCDNSSNSEVSDVALETRAQALGFSNTATYIEFVQTNCSQGNHENCNILANGEHRICDNANHEGQNHSGEHYNGSQHKNCGENHRACCSGKGENHNGNGRHN